MSRIGIQPVPLKEGVEFSVNADNVVTLKGQKGSTSLPMDPNITIEQVDNELVLKRKNDHKYYRALHGTYRSLLSNKIQGITEGYSKELIIIGVGFRAAVNNGVLELNLGFSHPIYFVPPDGIEMEVDTKKRKNPTLYVRGVEKEEVGQVAAKIRSLRPPEPYKGKGIRYADEYVRRKAGKSAAK